MFHWLYRTENGFETNEESVKTGSKEEVFSVTYRWKKLSIRLERSPLIIVLKSRVNVKYQPNTFDASHFTSGK